MNCTILNLNIQTKQAFTSYVGKYLEKNFENKFGPGPRYSRTASVRVPRQSMWVYKYNRNGRLQRGYPKQGT